jgi:hypothetical protein
MSIVHVLMVIVMSCALTGASCLNGSSSETDAGSAAPAANLGLNCGDPESSGNAIGIGKYCTTTSECPVAESGTTIQCSTVLTGNVLPLLCSRICGDTLLQGTIDCGSDAVCRDISELGYDLTVCVPTACDALFDDEPLDP